MPSSGWGISLDPGGPKRNAMLTEFVRQVKMDCGELLLKVRGGGRVLVAKAAPQTEEIALFNPSRSCPEFRVRKLAPPARRLSEAEFFRDQSEAGPPRRLAPPASRRRFKDSHPRPKRVPKTDGVFFASSAGFARGKSSVRIGARFIFIALRIGLGLRECFSSGAFFGFAGG